MKNHSLTQFNSSKTKLNDKKTRMLIRRRQVDSLKIYIFFVVFYLLFSPLFAAFLENVPFEIVQPDGCRYQAFITGDEYYRRVHDKNDYTMLLDRNTGYVVYAIPDGQSIKVSSYVVGRVDPASLGITPGLKLHDLDFQRRFDLQQKSNITGRIANIGQANCLVVFVRFSDQTEFSTTTPYQTVEDKFNGIAASSLRDYYLEISDDQLTLDSFLYPQPTSQGHIVSLINPQPRGYYSPWVQGTNEIGYLEGEGGARKRELFEWTVIQMNNYVPLGLNIDSDNDGINDALTIIVRGAPDAWGDLLWPTQSYSSDSYGSIHGKAVHNVILNIETALSTNIIIHEMGHLIGAPDFYHYYDSPMAHPPWNQIDPVGAWEMMSHNVGHWLTHTKYKYGGWFSNIPTIILTEELTTYSLSAIDISPHSCYKIQSSIPDQYYMLEYRRQSGFYETQIPGSGLIVTRVIEGIHGNASGPPDEHYIYRPNGTLTENGQLEIAHLNQQSGRTILINNSVTSPWLWADTLSTVPGNIMILNVGTAGGETITFDVALENSALRIWSGADSIDWHNPDNWWANAVPNIDSEVIIPSGTPNSPVISTNDAYCRNLTIESGACLTIDPRTLTVDGNANIYGHLVMNNNDSKLIVNGSLNWRDGSSADISNTAHTAQIDVYRHMNFSAGANVILDRGSVYFKGNQFSTIETLNSACSFNNLYLSKESSTVYLGTEYSVDLTITGELYNSYDCTARTLYDNNNINIYGDLFPSIIFHMEAGKINFLGNDQRIVVTNSSTDSINFNDVELNGSLTLDQFISTGGEININGDLIFNTGTLDAADIDIYLSGNWINNIGSSAFTPGTGSVIFNGTGDQTCNGGSFNILKLNKPSGQLIMSGSRTIQSYDWMDGIITFQSGYNQILDLTDNGFYGTWQVNGATLNIFQNAAQSVDLKGSMIIYSGAVNVFGGSGDSRWPGSASAYFYMAGGTLDFVDQGIFINTDYAFPHVISSGTIKTPYDFAVTRHDFTPTGGTIELYGNQAAEINLGSSSNLVNLKINKSSSSSDEIISRNEPTDPLRETAVTVLTDMDLAGSLLISGGVFNLNGHELDVAQNVEISGKLKMTNTADKLNVDGDVIWNSGSADEITTGEITLEGDWKFLDGTTATLGSGNTVRFVGSEVSEIVITEFTNAEFGDLIIDKTDNYIIIDISCSAPMKLAGNLTINEDNEFYVAYMEVDGDITLAAGSLLKIEFGQNEVEGNISVSGHLIVDDCNFFCSQAIAVNSGGSLTIDNDGDFVNDKPYTGNYLTFAGTLNILDGRFAVWDENVRFTSTPNFGENGVLELGRGLQANTANAFQPSNGALYFMGGSLSILDVSNGNYLHRLIINKVPTQSCWLNADLTVNENLSLSSGYLKGMGNELTVNNDLMIGYNGVLDPDDEVVKVGGFWFNNRGVAGFVEGEGTVRLIGNSTGGIASDETFYNLFIDKDYGTYWYTEIAADKTVQVENEFKIINGKLSPKANSALNVDGLLYLADGTGIRVFDGDDGVNLFVGGHWSDNNDDNASYCGFHPGSSTVTFDGSTDQVFTSSYSQPEFYNLTINKNDCHFIPYNNLIIGGDLLITDGFWSDYASNMSHTFLGSVDICENGWSARYSTVTFGGTEEAAYQEAGLCKFYNIIIDKNSSDSGRTAGELTLLSNIRTIWEGDLTIQSGTLNANGYEIGCTGNVTIDGGKLLLNDNSILKVGENKILSVNGSGRLESIGSAGSEATITNYVYNGYHDVYIYTGTIAAEHTIFKRMTTDGVYISLWGNVDTDHSFHNCTFQDGVSGGRLLRIKNDQDLVVNDAVFPSNSWGSSYNVYKNINQGSVEFINASGDFAGESHDYDPYNRLDWTIIIPPEIYVYPSEINYGNVYIGQSQIDGFHIQNTGGLPLSGTITAPEGYTVAYFSGDENEIRETRNTIDFMVEGGNDKAYSVLFEPLLEQSYNGNIVITHNAGGDDEIVQVTGAGIPVPPPEVTASPDSLHFGNVNLGNDKTIGFTIMNTGGSDLIGTVSTLNGFSIAETSWRNIETGERKPANLNHETGRNALSFDIEPYWQVDYDVAFEPTAMQEFFDYMIISSNAGQDVLIPCVGNGVDAVFNFSPHVINKTLQSSETDTENLNLSNAGNVPIDYLAYIEYENNVTTILSESFEGSTFPPAGWSLQSLDGWGNWEHCGYSGYAGTHSALASTMMVDDARLIAPAFTATADCIFRYWVRAEDPLMFFENALFEVEITTNGSDWITLQSYSQEIFTADWVPKGLALGAYAGQSVQLAFRVQDNSFGSGINVDDVQITGSASPAYSWLSLNGGNNITGTLAVGSPAVDKVIGFNTAGLADGSYYANIRFISNDATDPIDDVALVLNVGVYELTLTPSALDFGAVAVGDSATIQFTIENTGTLESYGEINPPAGYEVAEFWPERSSPHPESGNREQLYYMLFPNSSFTYEVTFTPEAVGDYSGNIEITNNLGLADELLPVSGVGLAAEISTQPVDFYQELQPEQTALQQLSIANLGNDDLTYSISISHSADGRDALVSTGFEDTTFPPAGWTEEIISGSVDWNQNSTYPRSGSYCAMADHLITDARLISPAFSAASDTELSYYVRTDDFPMYGGDFGVEVSTDGVNWSYLDQYANASLSATYVQKVVSLSAYAGSAVQIAFRMHQITGTADAVYLDDVQIGSPPPPTDQWLSLDGTATASGTITVGSAADIIEVGFDAAGLTAGSYNADIIIDSNDPFMSQIAIPTMLVVGYPQIVVSPDSIGYGTIQCGESVTNYFSIENTGTITLNGSITAPDGYTVAENTNPDKGRERISGRNLLSYEIAAGISTNFTLTFSPSLPGEYYDDMTVSHNSGGSDVEIIVAGIGATAPTVTTANITYFTDVMAIGGGNVTDDGYSDVTAFGVCWSTSSAPTLADDFTADGTGIGEFSSVLTGLIPETLYYVRAYAQNFYGLVYGSEVTFTTAGPTINITPASIPDFGDVVINTNSFEQSYTVSGEYLQDGINIIAPNGFAISLVSQESTEKIGRENNIGRNRDFSSFLQLIPEYGSVPATTIYVRFQPQSAVSYSGYLAHTSLNADSLGVAVSGNGVDYPIVSTSTISNIGAVSASSGGNVTYDGNSIVTARGVCWSTSANPTIADDHTSDGSGTGEFSSSLTGLLPGTLYYIRAYATNSLLTAYGNEETFTTATPAINVSVSSLPDFGSVPINTDSALQNYTVSASNLLADLIITAPDGFLISQNSGSDDAGRREAGDNRDFGSQLVLSPTNGVIATTTIYVKFHPAAAGAYSGNIAHTSTSAATQNVAVSGTGIAIPSVSTAVVTEITSSTATSGGNVTADGGSFVTARGVCWSTSLNPTLADNFTVDGDGTGSFVSSLSGLTPETHYYVRAYATNTAGTSYGDQQEFDTLSDQPPEAPANLTITVSGGNVNLSWNAVDGADSYKIYSSGDPSIALNSWNLEEVNITGTTWSEAASETRKFYFVKAVKNAD